VWTCPLLARPPRGGRYPKTGHPVKTDGPTLRDGAATLQQSFFAFDPAFRGGVFVG
jgi:hypothetical protein